MSLTNFTAQCSQNAFIQLQNFHQISFNSADEYASFKNMPKGIGEVLGENILRPILDNSMILFQRSIRVIKSSFNILHKIITINFFPVANAETVGFDHSNPSCIDNVCHALISKNEDHFGLINILNFQYQDLNTLIQDLLANNILKDKYSNYFIDYFHKAKNDPFMKKILKAKSQNERLEIINEIKKTFETIDENEITFLSDIQNKNFAMEEKEVLEESRKILYEKMIKLFQLMESYKFRERKDFVAEIINFMNVLFYQEDDSKQFQESVFTFFDFILTHVSRVEPILYTNIFRPIIVNKLLSYIEEKLLTPLSVEEDRILRETIHQSIDWVIDKNIAKPLFNIINAFECYIQSKCDLERFIESFILNALKFCETIDSFHEKKES